MKSKLLGVLAAAVAVVAIAAPAATATTPAPGYSQFAGCPDPKTEVPGVELCTRSVITGGNFKMGSKNVPIEQPITLSGGVLPSQGLVANSKGGMSAAKQKVPGGIVGLTGLTWLLEFFGSEALTLYAVTELAGQPFLGETISLPIKVHLIHPVLGNNCYVGSFANPIKLSLTTGTTNPPPPNKPITGSTGTFSFEPPEIFKFTGQELVDNSFSAPGASGCTLTLFGFIPISINGLVNSQSGLPAAAGTNETRQKGNLELANVLNVYP